MKNLLRNGNVHEKHTWRRIFINMKMWTDFQPILILWEFRKACVKRLLIRLKCVKIHPQMFCDDLREKIGRRYGVDSSFIICGNGASDVLYRYVFAIKPKNAVVAAPCFAEYEAALECVGAKVEYYQINHNTFEIEDDFMEMFEYKPDMIFYVILIILQEYL